MIEDPDFRSDKSDSVEGLGRAASRWQTYHHNLEEEVLAEAFPMPALDAPEPSELVKEGMAATLAADVMEEADLIGFWVAWHLAGGFRLLEEGGWHRATIFRKIRRFRARYGAHPDEYTFPWLRLDCEKAWAATIARRIENRPPGFFH